jgi:hypothetical protein
MMSGRQLGVLISSLALICVCVQGAGAQTASPSRVRVIPPATQPVHVLQTAPVFSATSVPGLGFDYTHLAARERSAGVRALVDPVTQHQLALERQARRSAPVAAAPAIFIPISNVVIVQQPPVVVIESPPVAQAPATSPASPAAAPAEAKQEVAAPSEPPRELEEILLIRRDGSALRVVAFSANATRLTYVTREGARRSLALAELDLEATILVNEDRGVVLKIRG